MLDKLDIYNLALSHLKEAPLISLTDDRKARKDCDIHYDIARLTLLKKHDWSFARQVIALTAITPDDDELIEGFDYYFEIPPEVLAIRGVYIHGDYENKLEPKEVYLPISKIKVIASNYDALDAICTMDIQESKYSVMPTATANTVDKVVQYIGQTGGGYTKRAFYKGIVNNNASTISADIGTSTGITDASVVKATFEGRITTTGTYDFVFSESISPTNITIPNVISLSIDKTIFETMYNTTGYYFFRFDGTDWRHNGNVVTLSDYGITILSGSPVENTLVTINYTQSDWKLDGSIISLLDYGITVIGTPSDGDTVTIDYTQAMPASYSWQLTTEKAVSDTNLELLDVTFCDALSFELAGRICATITGDDNLANIFYQKSEIKVQEAKTANLSEKYMFQKRTSDTLNARG